jgi:type VI secretion system protein
MDLKLTVMNGQHLMQGVDVVSVDSDIFSLGRGADNSCVLSDPKLHISSKHCVIHRKNNEYHLTDISTNGVYLNGSDEPIGRGRTAILKNSDRISMGEYVFRVDLKSAAGLAATDHDIDALLTPDSEQNDQPEFADIIQTIAPEQKSSQSADTVMGSQDEPVSFDALLGNESKKDADKSSPADISELLKPASPEKDHFTPPSATVSRLQDEPEHNDQAFVKPAVPDQNAIPDNWMDLDSSSSASVPEAKAPEATVQSASPERIPDALDLTRPEEHVSAAVAEEMARLHTLEESEQTKPTMDDLLEPATPSADEVFIPESDLASVQESIQQTESSAESSPESKAAEPVERKPTIVDIANALLDQKSDTKEPQADDVAEPKSQPSLDDLLSPDFSEASETYIEPEPYIESEISEKALPSTPDVDAQTQLRAESPVREQRVDVTGALLGQASLDEAYKTSDVPTSVNESKEEQRGLQSDPVAAPVAPAAAQSAHQATVATPASSDLFDLMLNEAGVPANLLDGRDKAAVAKEFGQMIQQFSQGIVETLATRSLVKSEFRLQQTMIRPTDNNPLKFSPSGTEALKIMMFADSSAYMSASRSVEEGFKDIQAHQLAMMSGIQAAFAHLLKRFEPDHLEGKFDRRPRHQKGLLGRNKTDYWLEYRDFYEDICTMMEDEFQDLFSAEFGKAYEDQLRNLK